ncbi:MAG: hypothetical protein K2X47_17925 [Bdellovibrionales bacterium]|nr:hypothetical protein [Bdellovibrionales bacterium]
MSRWQCSQKPELVPVPLTQSRYNQILAEVAELLYAGWASSLCPSQTSSLALSNGPQLSRIHRRVLAAERTGSHE